MRLIVFIAEPRHNDMPTNADDGIPRRATLDLAGFLDPATADWNCRAHFPISAGADSADSLLGVAETVR